MNDILGDETIKCLHKRPLPHYPHWMPDAVEFKLAVIRSDRLMLSIQSSINEIKARRYDEQ